MTFDGVSTKHESHSLVCVFTFCPCTTVRMLKLKLKKETGHSPKQNIMNLSGNYKSRKMFKKPQKKRNFKAS